MSLHGSTEILTPNQGWKTLAEVGTPSEIPVEKKIHLASVTRYGPSFCVLCSTHHPWMLKGGTVRRELQKGDRISAVIDDQGYDGNWWLRGFLFGIGHGGGWVSVPTRLSRFTQRVRSHALPDEPRSSVPYEQKDAKAISSFIRGWINTAPPSMPRLVTTDKEAINWFLEYAPYAGLHITGLPRYDRTKKGREGQTIVFHDIAYGRGVHGYYRVTEITSLVLNPTVGYETPGPIVIKGGILGIFH